MKTPFAAFNPTLPRTACLLESSKIFALRVAASKKDPTPLMRHSEDSPWAGAEPPFNREVLDTAVDLLLTRLGSPKRISVVLGDPFFTIQVLTLGNFPRGEAEREKVIFWQLRKLLDGPGEEFAFSYTKLRNTTAGTTLLVVACRKALVHMIEESFAKGGCRVGYVAPVSMVLHNLAASGDFMGEKGDALLINRAPGYVSFLFSEEGIPVYFRSKELPLNEDEEEKARRIELAMRLTLAYYEQKLRGPALGRILIRKWPEGSLLPVDETIVGEARIERIGELMAELPGGVERGDDFLPLFALMEGRL